jgi:hypothetical protein
VISRETREVAEGDPVPLVELYPALRQRLNSGNRNSLVLRCTELEEITRTPNGTHATPLESVSQNGVVKVRVPLDPEPMLVLIDRELGLGLGVAGCRAVLEHQERMARDSAIQAALRAVRDAQDVVGKIELLVGAEALRAGLPEGLMEAELQATDGVEPSARRIAQMAFNAHGDGVLQQHARDIQARFPNAPVGYTGSSAAVAFVSDLKLPVAFAGSRTPSPPPFETVEGPRDFPSLHDYQEDLVRNISTMLDRLAPQRGMLSLPTGAGKTRVTAEAVIRWVKRTGDLKGPLLWIAQTEELCEQAVQSWKFVWSKVGAERPLTISRLWGSNEVGNVVDHPHLVIATDAKLERCLGHDQYAWLRQSVLVVVDEAHTAISKRYTEILGLLGLTQYETGRHLLGLTATPFRNTNEEETRRLVNRFGNRRLDEGVFPSGDPYRDLQEWGMLAQVEHRTLMRRPTRTGWRCFRAPPSNGSPTITNAAAASSTRWPLYRRTGRRCCSPLPWITPSTWPPCSTTAASEVPPSTRRPAHRTVALASRISETAAFVCSPTTVSSPRASTHRPPAPLSSPGRCTAPTCTSR